MGHQYPLLWNVLSVFAYYCQELFIVVIVKRDVMSYVVVDDVVSMVTILSTTFLECSALCDVNCLQVIDVIGI